MQNKKAPFRGAFFIVKILLTKRILRVIIYLIKPLKRVTSELCPYRESALAESRWETGRLMGR